MSVHINAHEVLHYLNELGYYNITNQQLKEFIRDLKKLIKYDQRKKHKQNQENVNDENLQNYYEQFLHKVNPQSDDYDIENVVSNINKSNYVNIQKKNQYKENQENINPRVHNPYLQNVNRFNGYDGENLISKINKPGNRNHAEEIFSNLYSASTFSSRAKCNEKKQSDQDIISVNILKPKLNKQYSSSYTASISEEKLPEKSESSSGESKSLLYYGDTKSEPIKLTSSSRQISALNIDTKPKSSFIRPPKPVRVSKSDPVALYRQYQNEWSKQKLPGEDKRYNLRWAIRERMMAEPDVIPRVSKEIISRKGSRI